MKVANTLFGLLALTAMTCAQTQVTHMKAPELTGSKWVNASAPISLSGRLGKITVVHFWTFGCINCKHNQPAYKRLQQRFVGKDVELIGIHTPETDYEKVEKNVRSEIARQKITYPVLIDTAGKNWSRWGVQAWPCVYVIDKKGIVRQKWEGELNWEGQHGDEQVAQLVEKLLKE